MIQRLDPTRDDAGVRLRKARLGRVVPYGAGLHPGLVTGAFTLLDFPSNRSAEGDTAVVYAEGLTGELYLDKPREVQRYREAHAAILACALDEAATQDMLLAAAKDLER